MNTPTLILLTAALSLAGAASAVDTLQLTNEVFQEIEVTGKDGKKEKKIVPAAKIVPGTEVVYVITYKNIGEQPADQVVVTNPVPKELEYKPNSAFGSGAPADVSVDGGKQYGKLAALKVPGADGKPRPAQGADVTHVRWKLNFSVKPGDEGKVTFRAKLK